ncbi:MAG: hypothetical protein Q8O37_09455 [Sulfuricellaceae bacterium]|nr:hypothetical protein [Sulfuricellaceae bacterium]
MVSILDLCSGKWERDEMMGDFEWEVVCTGWRPDVPPVELVTALINAFDAPPRNGSSMSADLALSNLDEFLDRMMVH